MFQRHSIRFRLTVWYAAILTAGLGLFAGAIWFALRARLLSEVDEDLQDRTAQFEHYFRTESSELPLSRVADELQEFCEALPPRTYIVVQGTQGFAFQYPSRLPEHAASYRKLHRQFTLNNQVFELESGSPIGSVVHTLDLLRLLLLSLLPAVIAIACAGGWWLSGRALKPVQQITAAAVTIGIENLSERLPVPATGDELARLTEVLNSMLARLESAVRALSRFVADASHELRTPLAVIRTTAELALRRERAPESYRDSLQEVALETQRMTQLVEDLLILARGSEEMSELPQAPLDVREVLTEVCTELRPLADKRDVRIRTSLGNDPGTISANRPALHRLFVILIDNALKYSRPTGEVIVTVDHSPSHVAVVIQDFGTGISESDLPHIFERFYRAALSSEGHGLGLALADRIAKAHSATIEVRSTEGQTSIFRVSFQPRDPSP
ncbi:MAG TPA: HAMP domain-containing sensor histidine kinase [Bryobacteraceae bacterium]